MSQATLVVEDNTNRRHWFVHHVPQAFLVEGNDEAIRVFEQFAPWDNIILDFDLAPGIDSVPFARYLAEVKFNGHVVVSSENPFGMQVLSRILPTAEVLPFHLLRREVEWAWGVAGEELF